MPRRSVADPQGPDANEIDAVDTDYRRHLFE